MPVINPYAKKRKESAQAPAARAGAWNAPPFPSGVGTIAASATTSAAIPPASSSSSEHPHSLPQQQGPSTSTNGNEILIDNGSNGTSGDTAGRNGGVGVEAIGAGHLLDSQPHLLLVSERQRGNPVLRHIRNVPWAFTPPAQRLAPDYVWSATRCALFLSIKYHGLKPRYIRGRIGELGSDFACRVLLVLVDQQDSANPLLDLNALAVRHNLTMLLVWTEEEAARYLETFKAMDGKDATLIQRQLKSTFGEQVADVLVEGGVNRTDALQLLSQFGTVRSLAVASLDELGLVPGMGPVKVQRLHDAFHKPFSSKASALRKRRAREALLLNETPPVSEASDKAEEGPVPTDSIEDVESGMMAMDESAEDPDSAANSLDDT